MIQKPFPALCRDCRHRIPEPGSEWNSMCTHPKVNAKNEWALANTGGDGKLASSTAHIERGNTSLFAPCGRSGKLWEPRSMYWQYNSITKDAA
jgi:hypothetical protein